MKDLFPKLTKSEVRDRKKRFNKSHPRDVQKKNKEAFDKSYFGKEYINVTLIKNKRTN